MLIENISQIIFSSHDLDLTRTKLDEGKDVSFAIASSVRPFWIACLFAQNPKTTLVVVPGKNNAKIFYNQLICYLGTNNVLKYPGFKDATNSKEAASRQICIDAIVNNHKKLIVVSAPDLLRKLPSKVKNNKPICLKAGKEYNLSEIENMLVQAGYTRYSNIDGPGTFAVRGGVIDVFPAQLNYPVRLDFFGDELEEIKRIVLATGQTINAQKDVKIYPAIDCKMSQIDINRALIDLEPRARTNKVIRDYLARVEDDFDNVDLSPLLPYAYPDMVTLANLVDDKCCVVFDEPKAILDNLTTYSESLTNSEASEQTGLPISDLYAPPDEIDFSKAQNVLLMSLMQSGMSIDSKIKVKRPLNFKNIEGLSNVIKGYIETGFHCFVSAPNNRARHDLKSDLVFYGQSINETLTFDEDIKLQKSVANVTDMAFAIPFVLPEYKVCFLNLAKGSSFSNYAFSGQSSIVTQRKYVDVTKLSFPYSPGDYVVHSLHGIALFKDIVKKDLGSGFRDYLILEYDAGDTLYVPIEQLARVTRYVGPQGKNPRITRLGTADWSRQMSKARKASKKLAFDLVDVYSRRAIAKGHKFKADTKQQIIMESDFPYVETDDQIRAIDDVKADMESEKPMDRLICGDVGFGKTEVALRAAFKCIQDKMQVMVLCPTTILAQQHFTTFNTRLQQYGVRVEVLSRFKSTKETKDIIDRFATGKLDILIGTHRLLSRDINPANLGLIVIDEEQRFGVGHKEQLKNFRDSVDVLTLSATPIPRTMQMATSGVRDVSVILTPPDSRKAVDVHVGQWDPDIVGLAIRREVERGGQVYYISNRVKSIKDAVDRVGIVAEGVKIGVAHGQMKKDQLESIMEDFSAGKIDVLVSTTIVESGIDNPNTNTLIIEDSQNLGLSQMYQLKGRVGRSVNQAYAYFLFSDKALLKDEAVARLTAINELSELGSGIAIAMRDLEIRGAGNFLGAEQSGNISSVGFDLFAQMLKGAVEKAQEADGDKTLVTFNSQNNKDDETDDYLPPSVSDVAVNIQGQAFFPDDYIDDIDKRITWYRRLTSATDIDEVYDIESDLLENYPDMPQVGQNLILKTRIAGLALKNGFNTVSVVGGRLVLQGKHLTTKQISKLKIMRGRYLDFKDQISFSIKLIKSEDSDNLFADVFVFLDNFEL